MSGVMKAMDFKESADELHDLYKKERDDLEARKRLMALWLVRRGESVTAAAEIAGVGRRTLHRWLSWYTEGGLGEVLRRVPGHGAVGSECWLSEHQQRQLLEQAGQGEFRTYEEARRWVKETWGVEYRYKGIYAMLARLEVHPKVPRPTAAPAAANDGDNEITLAREAWKKGGS